MAKRHVVVDKIVNTTGKGVRITGEGIVIVGNVVKTTGEILEEFDSERAEENVIENQVVRKGINLLCLGLTGLGVIVNKIKEGADAKNESSKQ